MMKNTKYILFAILLFFGELLIAQNPTPVNGSYRYRKMGFDSVMTLPNDTLLLFDWFRTRPAAAIKNDSLLFIWSPIQQKYIQPKTGGATLPWSDIIGNISSNTQLTDSLEARQRLMPSGGTMEYISGEHELVPLDSAVTALQFIHYYDTIFVNLLNNSLDSLNFLNPIYREGQDIFVDYDLATWNAFKIQGHEVQAVQPLQWQTLQYDTLSGLLKWRHPDSAAFSAAVKYTDTALMLAPYKLKADSINLSGYATQYDLTQLPGSIVYTSSSGIEKVTYDFQLGGAYRGAIPLSRTTYLSGNNNGLRFDNLRFAQDTGTRVIAANNLALGNDGNIFYIQDTTRINGIDTANWANGSIVHLYFLNYSKIMDSVVAGAGMAKIKLDGGIDSLVMQPDDYLSLMYHDGYWKEIGRSSRKSLTSYNIYNKDTTFTSNRTASLNGKFFKIYDGASNNFVIDPVEHQYFLGQQESQIYNYINLRDSVATFNAGNNVLETHVTLINDALNIKSTIDVNGLEMLKLDNLAGAKATINSDSLYIKATSTGASVGDVWTLLNPATGSGKWETPGGSGSVEWVVSGLGIKVDSAAGRVYTINSDTASASVISRQRAAAFYTPLWRNVSTGYGLSGGGDLSADRTLIADTATLSGYYLRKADSVLMPGYVTQYDLSTQTLQKTFNTEVGGSVLTKLDTILTGAYGLRFQTSTVAANPIKVVTTAASATSIWGETNGNGWAGYFYASTNGTGVHGYTESGIGVYAQATAGTSLFLQGGDNVELIDGSSTQANTNSVRRVEMFQLISSGTVANGFGLSSEYLLETSLGGGSGSVAGRNATIWNDVTHATRTSWRDFYGMNSAVEERFMNIQPDYIRYNNDQDTVASMAYARSVGGSGGATDLGYTASTRILTSSTGADVTLPLFTSTDPGLTPLSGGGTTNFLRADGTWTTPPATTGLQNMGTTTVWSGSGTLTTGTNTGTIMVAASTETLTLPDLASNSNRVYWIKNVGAGNLVISRAGSDQLFTTTGVNSITLTTGQNAMVWAVTHASALYWHVLFFSDGGAPIGGTDLAYTASTRILTSSTGTDVTLPLFTSTDPGLAPLSGGGTTNFLRADGTWAAPAGGGDMVLASAQTVSGAKTFLDATLLMRNVANTFSSQFTNTNTAARTYTLPDRSLTIDNITTATTTNGTGFVKANGSVISFDNSTYLTSVGTGVANEITYWSGTNTLGSLATATYPSLTELSYVKGVTSSIQTQINAKGVGDMVLGSTQTVTGTKSFVNGAFALRNVANTFGAVFSNTNTASRTYTLKDANGTIAFVSDITGTNSGTNTGDVTLSGTPDYITITGQVITRGLIDLATDVTGDLPFANFVQGAANTVVTNPTTGTADFTTTALGANNLLGRGSTGNIAAITVGGILSFSGAVLSATEVDGSTSNEIQDITVTGTTTATLDLSSDASDASITGAGISVVSVVGNAITITSTEVDGSTTNEIQNITFGTKSGANIPLDISGGTGVTITEGTNVTITRNSATQITIDATGGGATNLTYTASTRLLESSSGTDVTLPLFTSTEAGLVPLSGGGTTNFLRADGTWAAAGGGVADGDKGDITVSSGGATWLYDFKRNMIFATVTGTDASITVAAGTAYHLPAATLSTGRNLDMTNVNVDGDYVQFFNNETGFVFTFTGQTVYDSDGTTTVTELLANANSVVRRINGKLMISKL